MASVTPIDDWTDVPNSIKQITSNGATSADDWSDVPNSTKPAELSVRDRARQHLAAIQSHTDFPAGTPNVASLPPSDPRTSIEQAFGGAQSLRAPTLKERAEGVVRDVVGDNAVNQIESFGDTINPMNWVPGVVKGITGEPARIKQAAQDTGTAIANDDPGQAIKSSVGMLPLVGGVPKQIEARGATGDVGGLVGDAAIAAGLPAVGGAIADVAGPALDAARTGIASGLRESGVAKQTGVIDPTGQFPVEADTLARHQLDTGTGRMTNPQAELASRPPTTTSPEMQQVLAENASKGVGAGEGVTGIASGLGRIAKTAANPLNYPRSLLGMLKDGFTVGKAIKEVVTSPGWESADAELRVKFANAIDSKNYTAASNVADEIMSGAGADAPDPTAPSIPPHPQSLPDTATIEHGGNVLPGREEMSFTPDEDLAHAAASDTSPEPQSPIAARKVNTAATGGWATVEQGGNKLGVSTRWPSAKTDLQANPQLVTAIAADTMQSPSYAKWDSGAQQQFGTALSSGDVGTAAATANLAEQQLSGTQDATLAAINHLSDSNMVDLYNGTGDADYVYVDPTGTVSPSLSSVIREMLDEQDKQRSGVPGGSVWDDYLIRRERGVPRP